MNQTLFNDAGLLRFKKRAKFMVILSPGLRLVPDGIGFFKVNHRNTNTT